MDRCYLRPEFNITCDQSTTPPSANLTNTTTSITNFSIVEGELQVLQAVAQDWYDDKGVLINNKPSSLELPFPYTISERNEFYAVGCNSIATYQGTRILGPDEEENSGNTVTVCENSLGRASLRLQLIWVCPEFCPGWTTQHFSDTGCTGFPTKG
ncbi:hypothetical protein ACLB2K_023754 [Fragaria x ananassa]